MFNNKELILTYRELRSGGEKIEPDNEWSQQEDEHIKWFPLEVFVDGPVLKAREKTKDWLVEKLNYDGEVNPGDVIYLMVIRYNVRGSFLRICDQWDIEGVFKDESEAKKIAAMIEKDEKLLREWLISHPSYMRTENDKPPEDTYGVNAYKYWRGYFQSFERVEIHRMTVQ